MMLPSLDFGHIHMKPNARLHEFDEPLGFDIRKPQPARDTVGGTFCRIDQGRKAAQGVGSGRGTLDGYKGAQELNTSRFRQEMSDDAVLDHKCDDPSGIGCAQELERLRGNPLAR